MGQSIMGLLLVPSKILQKDLDVASLCSGCLVTESKLRSGCGVWSVGAVSNTDVQIFVSNFFLILLYFS